MFRKRRLRFSPSLRKRENAAARGRRSWQSGEAADAKGSQRASAHKSRGAAGGGGAPAIAEPLANPRARYVAWERERAIKLLFFNHRQQRGFFVPASPTRGAAQSLRPRPYLGLFLRLLRPRPPARPRLKAL